MASSSSASSIVFVLGAPGSGKGTICHKLSQDYGFFHLSVGDYMRELSQSSRFDDQAIIQDYLREGNLLPTPVILPILSKKVEEEKEKGHHHFLIDGFPRQLAQGIEFQEQVGTPTLVIFFQCPQEKARQRYLSRKLPGRLLDDEKMFAKRFEEFERENPDILHFYQVAGTLEVVESSSETEVTYARLLTTVGRKYGMVSGSEGL